MNGYIAIYNRQKKEIQAESLYAAKQAALAAFKVPKSKEVLVSVMLCEVDGKTVLHKPASL